MRDKARTAAKIFLWVVSLLVGLAILGVVVWFGAFAWSAHKENKWIEAKLVELQELPAGKREQLAAECQRLLDAGKRAHIETADCPPTIVELAPKFVRVSDKDVLLYFSGGHFSFLTVYWWPAEDESGARKGSPLQLEIVTDFEDGGRILWP